MICRCIITSTIFSNNTSKILISAKIFKIKFYGQMLYGSFIHADSTTNCKLFSGTFNLWHIRDHIIDLISNRSGIHTGNPTENSCLPVQYYISGRCTCCDRTFIKCRDSTELFGPAALDRHLIRICSRYRTVCDVSLIECCNTSGITVTACDIAMVPAVCNGLSFCILGNNTTCRAGIRTDIFGAVSRILNASGGCSGNSTDASCCGTYQLCLASEISSCCLTNRSFVDSDDSADFFISMDRNLTADCNQFTIPSGNFSCHFNRTGRLIDSDNSADSLSASAVNIPCLIINVHTDFNASAVASCNPADIASVCRDIGIASILFYGSIRRIPADNSTDIAKPGDCLSISCSTGSDRSRRVF